MLPTHTKNMSEYIRKSRNRISNKQKNKRILSTSILERFNCDLFSTSVEKSHEDLGWDKGISFCSPKKCTVDLIATSNSENYSVDTNDDKDKNYQLSTTDEE